MALYFPFELSVALCVRCYYNERRPLCLHLHDLLSAALVQDETDRDESVS